MATMTTTEVKKGMITLPKAGDDLFVKRLSKPTLSLSQMLDKFRAVARKTKLSKKDVEEAIRDVRKKK